jgi:hypothetical protein
MLLGWLLGCNLVMDLLSTDEVIDASCAGTDTVVVAGRDLCAEYETTGRVRCDVGYRIRLDGVQVCPDPNPR